MSWKKSLATLFALTSIISLSRDVFAEDQDNQNTLLRTGTAQTRPSNTPDEKASFRINDLARLIESAKPDLDNVEHCLRTLDDHKDKIIDEEYLYDSLELKISADPSEPVLYCSDHVHRRHHHHQNENENGPPEKNSTILIRRDLDDPSAKYIRILEHPDKGVHMFYQLFADGATDFDVLQKNGAVYTDDDIRAALAQAQQSLAVTSSARKYAEDKDRAAREKEAQDNAVKRFNDDMTKPLPPANNDDAPHYERPSEP